MDIIRKGSVGQQTEKWQNFLRGFSQNSSIVVNGKFDNFTEVETKSFQLKKGLIADGVVGPQTLSMALRCGYPLMEDPTGDESGPSWPARPAAGPLNYNDREKLFGKFTYISTPTFNNPESITITGSWLNNLVTVPVSQLSGVAGVPKSNQVSLHSNIATQFKKLLQDWHDAGLTYLIITWGGSWSPRFIRGSRTVLSNHAWGTAFDINIQWNQLGVEPALKGQTGSVRELVDIAYQNGFYWGGWFSNRRDGMHFEAYKII